MSGLDVERKLVGTTQGAKTNLEARAKTATRPSLSGDDPTHSP